MTVRRTAVLAARRAGIYDTAKRVETTLQRLTAAGRAGSEQAKIAAAFYAQFMGDGDLCFDVGANHGSRVEVFRRLGARVIAIEPQSSCVQALQTRFGRDTNVTIVDAGLSSSSGERELLVASTDTLSTMSRSFMAATQSSGRFDSERWDSSTRVRVTTLDNLISVFGIPTFTKIDVEGHEPEVLEGLSVPLPAVSLEVVAELIPNAITCIDALAGLGRYAFAYSPGESFGFAWSGESATAAKGLLKQLVSGEEFGDLYAVFADRMDGKE